MRKTDLNAIYISERVQETLRPVSVSALTAVVAPMGYGKTTAVNWFLNQRRQAEAALILRVNIYSDNRFIFWKSVQNAFAGRQVFQHRRREHGRWQSTRSGLRKKKAAFWESAT